MGYARSVLGYTPLIAACGGGNTAATFGMNTVNNAVSLRFVAQDTRDVKSVWLNWSAVTTAGTVSVRIETDDGTGKPSGTLYDANASVSITPSLGWQNCAFAVTPSTGLVAGNLYHVVVITTATQTGVSLRTNWAPTNGGYPANALTATDGSVRTNFAETAISVPVGTVVFSDNSEEYPDFAPFAGSSNFQVYGTRAWGTKLVVPTGVTLSVLGGMIEGALKNGTPASLRLRIFDTGNSLVTGASATAPAVALTTAASTRRIFARFASAVSLAAGTYRAVWDQVGNATASGNNWQCYSASHRTSALCPSYLNLTTTTDITVGSPVWTDTNTDVPLMGLMLNDASASGGGGTIAIPAPPIRSNGYAFIG